MKNLKNFNSLKFKFTFICLITSLFLSAVLGFGIYFYMNRFFEKEQIQTTSYNLNLITDNIESELTMLYRIVLFCSTNTNISKFVSGTKEQAYTSYPISLNAFASLKAQLFNSAIESYINKIILYSKNDEYIIQGKSCGMQNDITICKDLPYYKSLLLSSDYQWIGLQKEPFYSSGDNTYSLPIIRPLIDSQSGEMQGWLYIALDPKIVSNKIETYTPNTDSSFYWCMDDNIYKYTSQGFIKSGSDIVLSDYIDQNNGTYLLNLMEDGVTKKAIYSETKNANWHFIRTLPQHERIFYKRDFINVLVPCIILLIVYFLIFGYILKKIISDPIMNIYKHIKKISKGNFSINPSLETHNEFGFIGKGINVMSQNISQLMDQQIKIEQEKRELELDNLQNQISPHFLYNTLYTIQWMANIQNARGISEMIGALSKIMKNISKNVNSKIALKDELDLLSSYIIIQRYRYGDSFSYIQNIQDDTLLNCSIFKFSLQPVIENSIFHGIGSKNQPGEIAINIFTENRKLVIQIKDTGVGITKEQIAEILDSSQIVNTKEDFKKIGLKNINRRIILEYGEEYGIQINSEVNQYTEVTIYYPIIFQNP